MLHDVSKTEVQLCAAEGESAISTGIDLAAWQAILRLALLRQCMILGHSDAEWQSIQHAGIICMTSAAFTAPVSGAALIIALLERVPWQHGCSSSASASCIQQSCS